MFVKAIETVTKFTRPLHSIGRNYGSTLILPGAATLFLVNSDGWTLTCKHVAQQLVASDNLAKKRLAFIDELTKRKSEKKKKEKQIIRELEQKYQYSKKTPYELHNRFVGCVDSSTSFQCHLHNKFDVALIRFIGFTRLLCDSFPIFAANGAELKQGKSLCRLGFPFVEFTNYAYDSGADTIKWTNEGKANTPRFPMEGMLTRHLDDTGAVFGFELSTPGLRGQSGGPAFDTEGRIWGMQSVTNHLDLNFDVKQDVLRAGVKKQVSDSAFLHVGHCIHVDVLKSFMEQHGVQFQEG